MVTSVAIGSVVFGDKEKPEKTVLLNEGAVVDLAELGGDDSTGADTLIEVKVPSAVKQSRSQGKGSAMHGGRPASVGHLYGFGNTEEFYRVDILGTRRRGRPRDGPLDHKKGKGWVKARRGTYHDGLVLKRSKVVPFIVETTGGVSPHARAQVSAYARRAASKGKRDSTKYGQSRTSTKEFYHHHMQQISKSAVVGDAQAARLKINDGKQECMSRRASRVA